MRNWCSGVVTAIVAGTVAVWLAMPVIDSMHAGTRDQVSSESQAMVVYLAAGLVLLAVCRWVDDGRRIWRVGLLVCLVVSNALVRVIMSPRVFGVEPVFVLLLLVGVSAGASAGFFVGAGSCLLSSMLVDTVAAPLPGQMLAWGLTGLIGALLVRVPTKPAWLLSWPLAVLCGPVLGVMLNLIGWPTEGASTVGQTTSDAFVPGLPAMITIQRLIRYSVRTSLGIDLTRGVCTLAGVVLVGLPAISALRTAWGRPDRRADETPTARGTPINPAAVERRQQSRTRTMEWSKDQKEDAE